MPAVKQVIDGLWSYLCPSPHISKLQVSRVASRPTAGPFKRCLNFQRLNDMRILTTIPRAALRCSAPRFCVCPRNYVHQKAVFSALELRDQAFTRELDIQTVYQKLRRLAVGGNHSQIQACVKILFTERGQRPNVRLYEVLLLANVDHEYGSASETSNLLEEMATEGITPDSATYHAVLKVGSV